MPRVAKKQNASELEAAFKKSAEPKVLRILTAISGLAVLPSSGTKAQRDKVQTAITTALNNAIATLNTRETGFKL